MSGVVTLTNDTSSKVSISVEPPTKLGEEVGFVPSCVSVAHRGEHVIVDVRDGAGNGIRQRVGTRWAKRLVPLQRRPTRGTLIERAPFGLFLGVNVVVVKNEIVHLLVSNPRIDAKHPRVLRPSRSVLDCLFVHVLADPARDCCATEQACHDTLAVEPGTLGNLRDDSSSILLSKCAVFILVPSAQFVDEGRIGIVWTGVLAQPIRDVAAAPRKGLRSVVALHIRTVIDRQRRAPLIKADVAYLEAQDRTDPEARIVEQGDQRAIARVRTCIEKPLQLVGGNFLVGVVLSPYWWADRNLGAPVNVAPDEKLPNAFHVVADCSFGETVLVLEVDLQGVHVVDLVHRSERHMCTLGGETNAIQVADDGTERVYIGVIRSEVNDELPNLLAVVFVDVGVFEPVELVLVLPTIPLDVIRVDHANFNDERLDYRGMASNPGTICNKTP